MKVQLDAAGLRSLRERAVNMEAWADVALEWMDKAEKRIVELERGATVSVTDKTYYHCPTCNHPIPFREILMAVAKVNPLAHDQAERSGDSAQPEGGEA